MTHEPFIHNDTRGHSLTFHGGALDEDGQDAVAIEADHIGRGSAWVHVRHTNVARVADELRAAAGLPPAEARPQRGDQFETWLKEQRDEHNSYGTGDHEMSDILDNLLDRYRLHADTGTPLGEHVCEGRVAGDCECLERPAKEA